MCDGNYFDGVANVTLIISTADGIEESGSGIWTSMGC